MTPAEKKAVDTIRCLSMDAVQVANSGHPGTAMALAPLGYLLFNEVLQYSPERPRWVNRDRFVLSIGHASMLLYSLLHLSGVKEPEKNAAVSLDDIKNFRQLGSKCAGHPEYRHVTGVEMTTGPLGAGVATSVGMAIAEKHLADRFNTDKQKVIDYNVYAVCGDGCMMEGITSEAASLAGHLKLDNLCWFYDDNGITIEGNTSLAFSEDVTQRFNAYGWNVLRVDDVNDLPQLRQAIDTFKKTTGKPTLIIVKSQIAFGSPKLAGSHEAHGAPLGEDEIKATKKIYGFDPDKKFVVDADVYETFKNGIGRRADALLANWQKTAADYDSKRLGELEQLGVSLPDNWDSAVETFPADAKGLASRASSGKVLNQLASKIPSFIGGSADLAPSNNTWLKDTAEIKYGEFGPDNRSGRNLHFGIREHAMAAITNGLVLSGLHGYCATFFVFADYLRPAIRLAALMQLPTLFIFTHDSIGVGEDGPTHQPVEHLAALRAIPNVAVFRPADANETAESYKAALKLNNMPSVLVLTRQNLPTLDRSQFGAVSGVAKGGYIVAKEQADKPDVILIASGSEVGLCLSAWEKLTAEGIKVRVVSMPCFELFGQQPESYRNEVLPPAVKARVGVELGVELGWHKYIGDSGVFIGMSGFGASAPAGVLMKHFGFTPENVCAAAKKVLGR
jgi:transketolase